MVGEHPRDNRLSSRGWYMTIHGIVGHHSLYSIQCILDGHHWAESKKTSGTRLLKKILKVRKVLPGSRKKFKKHNLSLDYEFYRSGNDVSGH